MREKHPFLSAPLNNESFLLCGCYQLGAWCDCCLRQCDPKTGTEPVSTHSAMIKLDLKVTVIHYRLAELYYKVK